MKTLILLSTILLTAASVNGQPRDGSGNRRNSGNKPNSATVSKETRTRDKSSVYSQPVPNNSRRNNIVNNNDNRQSRRNDVANNNSRVGSFREVRRETNNSNSNERPAGTDFNRSDKSRRNSEKIFISNRDYTPVYRKEFRNSEHFGNNNFESHHVRIEHGNYREYDRSRHFLPLNVRRERFPFILPRIGCLIWSLELRNEYFQLYPEFRLRDYNYGYRVPFISAYDANEYVGEIATVYGDILAVEYSPENDEYYFYVGQYFPNQDFSVVVPGHIARNYSLNPESFFQGSHIAVSGLITSYNNRPEIVVKRAGQINRYYR